MSQDPARNSSEALGRSGRTGVLGFLADPVSEQVVRDGLADMVSNGLDLRRGGIRTAIGAMAKLATPEILIVDLSGETQPLQALEELFEIVEPGVHVLAIGETDDVDFYRHVTRRLRVSEYIFKPITRVAVARHFAPLITHKSLGDEATRGGRVIAITGTRGGVGATSIAANLAWHLGVAARRHTVFVEADLHLGGGAMLLCGKTSPGLRQALENPGAIDPVFATHLTQPVSDRLHLLASEERLDEPLNYAAGAAARLIEMLRARFNFIVLDVPLSPAAFNREALGLVHHRVIVMDPTLASVRDCLRLLALPNAPWQPQTPTLILNRLGRPGGLTRRQIEDALKTKIHITVPDMPKLLGETAHRGDAMLRARSAFAPMIADLSREIGFVGARDGLAAHGDRRSRFTAFFRKSTSRRG